jgi:hypothetical protein
MVCFSQGSNEGTLLAGTQWQVVLYQQDAQLNVLNFLLLGKFMPSWTRHPHVHSPSAPPCPQVLEFQAYRLTSSGLAGLMGLESLECLSIHGLDSWASDTACFRMRPSLKELHLGCEYELPPEAVQRLSGVPDLSMRFR